ncbi:MAG: phenylacetic acid degradation operon negative regulatory protein PaaX [Rhodocyclaceae bacterium]|nr:phenylacetic acid degradation operon negative regulatory protein PaaX [Rhodocyclaceae bacterium]
MENRSLSRWIADMLAERPVRANSLIITIFGDMIAPHGGTVWLGSLIALVAPFGINARLVRTSVFRLSREKWLVSQQIGRRSHYSLTAMGHRRFEHAYRRIYNDPRAHWDGDWQLVIVPGDALTTAQRDTLRTELLWEGFGSIAPGVMAHPSASEESLLDILQSTGTHDKVVVLRAHTLGALAGRPLKTLVEGCWNLRRVADEYLRFLEHFRPVARMLRNVARQDPEQCFIVRVLLMHEFRRVQLRDPQLPSQLLPTDWPGDKARALCTEIYRLCRDTTERHLMMTLETPDGPLPKANATFQERFREVGVPPSPA